MTAIFNSLAVLGFRAKDQYTLIPLVNAVFDEAIKQIDSLPQQDIANWERYKELNEETYLKAYGDMGEFEMKMGFIAHAHTWLDHEEWHGRVFENARGFEYLIHRIKRLLLAKKMSEAYFTIRDVHWKHRKKYSAIFVKLKELLKSGRIPQPSHMDKATKKWLGDYNSWIPLDERLEEMKKQAEQAREKTQKERRDRK